MITMKKNEILDINNLSFSQKKDTIIHFLKLRILTNAILKDGEKIRLFISTTKELCQHIKGSSRKGFTIGDKTIESISKLNISNYLIKNDMATMALYQKIKQKELLDKAKNKAKKATFTNNTIETLKTSSNYSDFFIGCKSEGKIITVNNLVKKHSALSSLKDKIQNQENFNESFCHQGYDASIQLKKFEDGSFKGWLNLHYKNTGNGYGCILINDNEFMFVDYD